MCTSSPTWDSYIYVRSGAGACGTTTISSDDDFCGPLSRVSTILTSGTPYVIIIEGYNSSTQGAFTLAVTAPLLVGYDCSNPDIVNSYPYSSSGTTCGSRNDYSAPLCSGTYGAGEDYVYQLNITTIGPYTIEVTATGGGSNIGWFLKSSANCATGSSCLANATSNSGTVANGTYNFTSAGTYYLIIDTWPFPTCSAYTINITGAPANDNCAGATNLTPTPGVYTSPGTQSSTNATSSGVAILNCNYTSTSALDVWYSFTTGATGGDFNAVVVGSGGFNLLVVQGFSGTCGDLSSLGCIGTSFQDNTETLPLTLAASTTYYLRVYGYNGSTVSFTISLTGPFPIPICSTTPVPTNAATEVPTLQQLSWAAASGATSYDVYFGTATNPPLVANVTSTSYNPGTLTGGTTYYWKIVPKNASGSATGCSVWTFSTISCPGGLGTGVNNITLPYTATGLSTCGDVNDITSTNVAAVCADPSSHWGEDEVYIFTPTSTASHVIAMTTGTDDNAAIFLYQGCPVDGGTCVGFSLATWGLTRSITAALTSGVTYYLVVDSYLAPPCITTYSLNIAPAPALPLELASFTGKTESRSNMLRWETLTEKNVQWHIVERSVDGIKWMEVGKTAGQMDAQVPVKYELEDRAPLAKAYYRLRSVDYDGAENFSNSIVLTRKGEHFGITAAFPSPTKNELTVQFASLAEETVTIQVTDFAGRLVLTQEFDADNGINEAVLQLANLQTGVYLVRISNATTTAEPMRIVKE